MSSPVVAVEALLVKSVLAYFGDTWLEREWEPYEVAALLTKVKEKAPVVAPLYWGLSGDARPEFLGVVANALRTGTPVEVVVASWAAAEVR